MTEVPDPHTIELPLLVQAAAEGDENAWEEVVRRHAHLVISIARQFRLSTADVQDVSQTVWLRLVEHLSGIREPAALAAWIITTTRHACLRQLRGGNRTVLVDPQSGHGLDQQTTEDVDGGLLMAERHQALRDGLAELSAQHRRFLTLLATDPPYSYAEISEILGIPIGSIGPTRSRILQRLRQTTAIRTYLESTGNGAGKGGRRHALAELE